MFAIVMDDPGAPVLSSSCTGKNNGGITADGFIVASTAGGGLPVAITDWL